MRHSIPFPLQRGRGVYYIGGRWPQGQDAQEVKARCACAAAAWAGMTRRSTSASCRAETLAGPLTYVHDMYSNGSMLPGHEYLLKALGDCRREAVAVRRMHRPRSGMGRCLDAMIDEMDAVAELITASPSYFHDKGTIGRPREIEGK
jgi:hypothetical protein